MARKIRLAARALILKDDRLLLVNAWRDNRLELWCAPGGGAELHQSLPENLAREVYEETGLRVTVKSPALINEFHDPNSDFHQVEIFFRCEAENDLPDSWQDTENVVNKRRYFSRKEVEELNVRPKSLADIAWNQDAPLSYDALEPILR